MIEAAAAEKKLGEFHISKSSYEQEITDGAFTIGDFTKTGDGIVRYEVTYGTDIISVDQSGVVTPKKLGYASVKVFVEDGQNYEYMDSHYDIDIHIISSHIMPQNTEHTVFSQKEYTLVLESPKWVSVKIRKKEYLNDIEIYGENDPQRENPLLGGDEDKIAWTWNEETSIGEWDPVYLAAGTYTILASGSMIEVGNDRGKDYGFSLWINTADEVDLSKTDIRLNDIWAYKTCTYNGEEFKPVPVLEYYSNELKEGVHYTLSYENNINAGKGVVVANAVPGASTGSKKITFDIHKSAGAFHVNQTSYTRTFSQGSFDLKEFELVGDGEVTYSIQEGTDVISVDENGKVTPHGIGEAVIYVQVKENTNFSYEESGSYQIKIKLAKSDVMKVKKASRKSIKVKPKYTAGCTGYQYLVSRSAGMQLSDIYIKKGSKASWTYLKVRKGVKKYYVKVRPFAYDNDGKRVYGAWSKKKMVKMK
ncbi:MAG: hypothetical protein MR965_04370 [Lachnospiraceae bacterium]|nr:hypothetical protein [Lachnospiraceae bacterium]